MGCSICGVEDITTVFNKEAKAGRRHYTSCNNCEESYITEENDNKNIYDLFKHFQKENEELKGLLQRSIESIRKLKGDISPACGEPSCPESRMHNSCDECDLSYENQLNEIIKDYEEVIKNER